MNEFRGSHNGEGMRIALVVSKFNETITNALYEGAVKTLTGHGVLLADISAFFVPGAWEIPLLAQKVAEQKKFDAIICLGAVIRGDTSHYDVVAEQSADGITQTSLKYGIPILSGILTTENTKQAEERCGIRGANKGTYCAEAALEMVNLLKIVGIRSSSIVN